MIKKIAVLTSGGDAPGMNAAIRAVVRTALHNGLEVSGIKYGYQGLLDSDFVDFGVGSVGGILLRGGTVLHTARCETFMTPEGVEQGAAVLKAKNIDALVVIGGDGSFHGAKALSDLGVKVAGVPATIDNDMGGTDYTIGFDTACNTTLDCVAKLRDTASSHDRLFIVEVMGRSCGAIALRTGVACGAEYIAIPERPTPIEHIIQKLKNAKARNKSHSFIITAEGVYSANKLAEIIKERYECDPRVVVLGHLIRGGQPSCLDSVLASRLGSEAIMQLIDGASGIMVGVVNGALEVSPLVRAWKEKKQIDESMMKLLSVLSV